MAVPAAYLGLTAAHSAKPSPPPPQWVGSSPPLPTATPFASVIAPRQSPSDFQAGVTVVVYGHDPLFRAKAQRLLNHLAAAHANSVALMVPVLQGGWSASVVYADRDLTPPLDDVGAFLEEAHQRGFTVMLRPILDERWLGAAHWRGDIQPRNRALWFQTYRDLMVSYARVAQDQHADIFNVGTELNSLQPYTQDWLGVIAAVRSVFSGQVIYSENYNAPDIGFGRALDYVGVDAFFPLDAAIGASTGQLAAAWRAWLPQIRQMGGIAGKPVIITEIGVTSEAGSYRRPYVWRQNTGLSLETQQRYYDASCQVLKPQFAGLYWWEFDLNPPVNPQRDLSFTPQGKPAEASMQRCFSG